MLKKLCQCLGLSSLILVTNYGDLLGGGADARMHTPFPLTRVCLAQIADILLVALLLFVPFVLLARTRFYPRVCLLLLIAIPLYLAFMPFDRVPGLVALASVAWTAIVLLLLLNFGKLYTRLLRIGSALTASLAVFALASIAQLLWVSAWRPAPNQFTAAWESSPQPPRQHPLLVWIVFDELSYDQLFEHRAPGLSLPNFDALRAQSTLFTDTQPAGLHTVTVLPSLLTGSLIDGVRFSFHNRLSVHHPSEPGWQPIAGADTVFADAERNGWRTAVVGWYNPYCAIYGDALQSCYWINHDMLDGPMAQSASLAANIRAPLLQFVGALRSPTHADCNLCSFEVHQRHLTETDLQQHAFQLLHADQADFVFLHLAIPHSPNTWNRAQNGFTDRCGSSYIDNLALTDRVLGQFLATLQASPRWGQTALIVQGDHSWRTILWRGRPAWTDEDEDASRGVFDQRPALIVHLPGQAQHRTVATPWPIVQVHAVIEQILHRHSPTL